MGCVGDSEKSGLTLRVPGPTDAEYHYTPTTGTVCYADDHYTTINLEQQLHVRGTFLRRVRYVDDSEKYGLTLRVLGPTDADYHYITTTGAVCYADYHYTTIFLDRK